MFLAVLDKQPNKDSSNNSSNGRRAAESVKEPKIKLANSRISFWRKGLKNFAIAIAAFFTIAIMTMNAPQNTY